MGFVRKHPKQKYAKASEQKKEFLEYLAYLESLRSKNGLTFYLDQAKFYDKPDLGLKWVLKGKEATVTSYRSGREKVIYYGAYCPQNQFILTEEVLEETSDVTASFFISLRARFPHRRIDVIMDNARWHYGNEVKRIAKIYNIHLHYLPPYAPDLNSIEPLWYWIRQEVTKNYNYESINEKTNEINNFIHVLSFGKEEVKKRLVMKI